MTRTDHSQILATKRLRWTDESDCRASARALAASPAIRDAYVELDGPLGSGKTTFVRHLLRSLGVQGRIKSPTFAVLEPYTLPAGSAESEAGPLEISHFDFYRFGDPREWEDAGFRDVFGRPGLKLAEWPGNAAPLLPPPDLRIELEPIDEDQREVTMNACTETGLELIK